MRHESIRSALSGIGRMTLVGVALMVGAIGLVFNPNATFGLAFGFGVLTALHTQLRMDAGRPCGLGRAMGWRTVALGFAAAPVIAGLASLIGTITWSVLLVVLAVALGRWGWSGRTRAGAGAAGAVRSTPTEGSELAGLTDRELGDAWRQSYAQLRRARTAAQMERLFALRRRQLDEMERRDSPGFRRWVGSSDWISGQAAPFLER